MINYIFGLWTNDINCIIDPHVFHYRRGDKALEVQTYLYVTLDVPPRVMSVGTEINGSHQCKRVNLFDRVLDNPITSKGEYLVSFLKYSFNILANNRVMVRPKVIFQNSQSLHQYLSGYQHAVLADAAGKAGAREVIFTV